MGTSYGDRKQAPRAGRLPSIILEACLGALLGFAPFMLLLFTIVRGALFPRWEPLPRPPTQVIEILDYAPQAYVSAEARVGVWVRTEDGATYECRKGGCQQKSGAPADCTTELWSCERRPRSLPEPPGEVVDSLKIEGRFPSGSESTEHGEIYIVALQDGSLWIQRRVVDLVRAIGVGVLGLCAGLGLAIGVPVIAESLIRPGRNSRAA
jgi:hypothetical protein